MQLRFKHGSKEPDDAIRSCFWSSVPQNVTYNTFETGTEMAVLVHVVLVDVADQKSPSFQ